MNFPDNYFEMMCHRLQSAFRAMTGLKRSAIANPDANRKETRNGIRGTSGIRAGRFKFFGPHAMPITLNQTLLGVDVCILTVTIK